MRAVLLLIVFAFFSSPGSATNIATGDVLPEASGGTFDGPFEVEFYSPTQGASFAYTTDTGEDARRLLYAGPIKITETTTFRARAIRYGYKESEETVATFTIKQ